MPRFRTRTTNSAFDDTDDGVEYPDLETAYAAGIAAAVMIGAEEMVHGATIAMMEVCIENLEGERLARGIVSLSTSRLSEV